MSSPGSRASSVAVAASVGGTKIACGAVDESGRVVLSRSPLPTPRDERDIVSLIASETRAVADAVGIANVYGVGVSYPECVPPPISFAQDAPDAQHPLVARVATAMRASMGAATPVAVLHDAAAAVLGEVGRNGSAPGAQAATFIVWGTGMASGVVRMGALYWDDPLVGQMVSEAGGLVVRLADGGYEFRPSASWPRLAPSEQSMDARLGGPALTHRARAANPAWSVGSSAGRPGLAAVNEAARSGDRTARAFIIEAGRECGYALAAFIHYWRRVRGEAFASRIIVGSGVARMGDGLTGATGPLLEEALRNGVGEGLADRCVHDYDAEGVVVSTLGYEREFLAFTPPWPGKKDGSGTGNRTPV